MWICSWKVGFEKSACAPLFPASQRSYKFPISMCFYSLIFVIASGGTVHTRTNTKGICVGKWRAVSGTTHVNARHLCYLTRRDECPLSLPCRFTSACWSRAPRPSRSWISSWSTSGRTRSSWPTAATSAARCSPRCLNWESTSTPTASARNRTRARRRRSTGEHSHPSLSADHSLWFNRGENTGVQGSADLASVSLTPNNGCQPAKQGHCGLYRVNPAGTILQLQILTSAAIVY